MFDNEHWTACFGPEKIAAACLLVTIPIERKVPALIPRIAAIPPYLVRSVAASRQISDPHSRPARFGHVFGQTPKRPGAAKLTSLTGWNGF